MARSSAGSSALSRAVAVLETFDIETRDLSATEIAERADMPLSTAHRILGELVRLELLERTPDRRYRIGLHLWELAVRSPGALGIRQIALPTLRAAHAAIGQNLQLGILQGDEVLYLERLSAPGSAVNFVVVGGRLPFHATSSGLVLAAFAEPEVRERLVSLPLRRYAIAPRPAPDALRAELAAVRRRGHAVTRGYVHPAATAIAVPVRGPLGGTVAAISAIVPTEDPRVNAVLGVLHPAARQVTEALRRSYAGQNEPPR